jgi:hypothetical protein
VRTLSCVLVAMDLNRYKHGNFYYRPQEPGTDATAIQFPVFPPEAEALIRKGEAKIAEVQENGKSYDKT